jgi:hypothetical protein
MNWELILNLLLASVFCVFGFIMATKPKKVRDFYLHHLNKSDNVILRFGKGFVQEKWYLINIRMGGIFLIFFGLLIVLFYSLKLKWIIL